MNDSKIWTVNNQMFYLLEYWIQLFKYENMLRINEEPRSEMTGTGDDNSDIQCKWNVCECDNN